MEKIKMKQREIKLCIFHEAEELAKKREDECFRCDGEFKTKLKIIGVIMAVIGGTVALINML